MDTVILFYFVMFFGIISIIAILIWWLNYIDERTPKAVVAVFTIIGALAAVFGLLPEEARQQIWLTGPSIRPTAIVMPAVLPTPTSTGRDGMILVPQGDLDAFWIDQTEVTNEMFRRFVDDTGYQTDAEEEAFGWTFTGIDWEKTLGANWLHPHGPNSNIDGLEQHPVVQVTWNDAKAYCELTGKRLPTEGEWQKVAQGTDGRKYPWGNESIAGNRLNFCDINCSFSHNNESINDGNTDTAPVGTYPDGASPYGALDMAGNVWEWTSTGVLRGGSWISEARNVDIMAGISKEAAYRSNGIGIRCADDP